MTFKQWKNINNMIDDGVFEERDELSPLLL